MKEFRHITIGTLSKPDLLPGQLLYGFKRLQNATVHFIADISGFYSREKLIIMETSKITNFVINREIFKNLSDDELFLINGIAYSVLYEDDCDFILSEIIEYHLNDNYKNEDDDEYIKEGNRLLDKAYDLYYSAEPYLKAMFEKKYNDQYIGHLELEDVTVKKHCVVITVNLHEEPV